MRKYKAGDRRGNYTLLRTVRHKNRSYWLARCDCGTEKPILPGNKNEAMQCNDCHTRQKVKHGHYRSPTWYSWQGMKGRCNGTVANAQYWHGRGITYSPEWETFENFLSDMGERPEGMTLDRIDNHGNYEPGNCRWATPQEQADNRG